MIKTNLLLYPFAVGQPGIVRPTPITICLGRIVARFCLLLFALSVSAGEIAVQNAVAPSARFKLSGWVESGVTANFDGAAGGENFGHLFTDRANEPLLNQFVITAERSLATSSDGFDWGFKTQFLYGSDARYIHSLGLFDNTQHDIVQPDVQEAWIIFHLPVPSSAGGLDIKAGKFVTLEGAETIDPRTNVFYSHSYIFNFGIPLNHTGALTIFHPIKGLDLYAGVTRGANTSITDNNSSAAFHGGIGLSLRDGALTALATTHIGPENPHNNHDPRYLNDLVVTWKATAKFTTILDANFAEDESVPGTAKAYGAAIYITYAVNDWLTLGLREEVYRDEKGFFVGSFADNDDFIDIERGKTGSLDPSTYFSSGTFNEVTFGATFKVDLPKPLTRLTIRPELRYDAALTSATAPFADHTSSHQFTVGLDAVIEF